MSEWKAISENVQRENKQLQEENQRLRAALETIKEKIRWGDAQNAIDRVEKIVSEALSGKTEQQMKEEEQ